MLEKKGSQWLAAEVVMLIFIYLFIFMADSPKLPY